jgi:hypothetical protein
MKILTLSVLGLALSGPTLAASSVPPPVDRPYAGVLQLEVDATNVGQRIFATGWRRSSNP